MPSFTAAPECRRCVHETPIAPMPFGRLVARCQSLPDSTEMVRRVRDCADRHAQRVLVPHGVRLHGYPQTVVLAPHLSLQIGPLDVVPRASRPAAPAIA